MPSMQDMADGHYVLYSVDENGVFDFCIRFLSIFLYNFIYFFISIIIKVIRFFFSESDCAINAHLPIVGPIQANPIAIKIQAVIILSAQSKV